MRRYWDNWWNKGLVSFILEVTWNPGIDITLNNENRVKIKCYVNFGVFNSGDFKYDLYFHFRIPPTPARTPPGWGLRGARGGIPPKIKWYVNLGVFNSGETKNDLHSSVPPAPTGASLGGGGWRPSGSVESYTTKYHVICQFWGV